MGIARAALAFVALAAAYTFVFWIAVALLPFDDGASSFIASVLALVAAVGAAWFVWRRGPGASSRPGLGHYVLKGAIVTGTIGFVGGFFGPMVFAPDANQGPLLGLFITGPGGVVLGAVGGVLYWMSRGRPAA